MYSPLKNVVVLCLYSIWRKNISSYIFRYDGSNPGLQYGSIFHSTRLTPTLYFLLQFSFSIYVVLNQSLRFLHTWLSYTLMVHKFRKKKRREIISRSDLNGTTWSNNNHEIADQLERNWLTELRRN